MKFSFPIYSDKCHFALNDSHSQWGISGNFPGAPKEQEGLHGMSFPCCSATKYLLGSRMRFFI